MPYEPAFELQTKLVERLACDDAMHDGYLLLLEHPPTFTIGRGGSADSLRVSPEEIARRGATLVNVNRGGDVTFHGPGQVVAYPVLRLHKEGLDVHRYLRQLEESVIRTLAHFGVMGERSPGLTGVWVADEKIAAIGVAIRRWIAYHGVALNVTVDLSYFDLIHPCGIRDRGVTSLSKVLGRPAEVAEVADTWAIDLGEVLDMALVPMTPDALREVAST